MPAASERQPVQPEKGWSSAHDIERKQMHDFNNLLGELVAAVYLDDETLAHYFMEQTQAAYAAALKRR